MSRNWGAKCNMAEGEERGELDLLSPQVVAKYKLAAEIVNKALEFVLTECKPAVKIADICNKGDSYIREQTRIIMYNNSELKNSGVAFPTCLSINNMACHFSPLADNNNTLEEGYIVKINMGCHIDGFIAVVAHTYVLQQGGPVTGRAVDVIAAANTAAENYDVTEAIQKVATAYDYRMVENVVSHQLKQFVIDGETVFLSVSNSKNRVYDYEFKENEVYAIDIVTSTGDGKGSRLCFSDYKFLNTTGSRSDDIESETINGSKTVDGPLKNPLCIFNLSIPGCLVAHNLGAICMELARQQCNSDCLLDGAVYSWTV